MKVLFGDLYTYTYTYYTTINQIIAHNIIVSFCLFSLLTFGRIFGKKLEHDTDGLK